ncbi:sugar phosphate isomerase/epimerase family protein [uncultured Friedmanniella sp.]|uniref:sugar phosphate isomerase/epimerase family protein n=1 Tax=uncultured Friedmanniella sp. TaxID=335381 RepID=UPI0035CA56DD
MNAGSSTPALVATCWTSAGDVAPLDDPEVSPFSALERVHAVASTGWTGLGFGQDDLRVVRDTIGFAVLRTEIESAGLRHVEVELASGWWRDDVGWRDTWEPLLEAAAELGASFIKVGTAFGSPVLDVAPFVAPLRRLAAEAAAAGTRVALEPLPFGYIGSIPAGADLVRAAGHPAAGLLVDFWHVFRAGTTLWQLVDCLDASMVFGVELSDAAAECVGSLFEDTRDRRTLLGDGAQDVPGFIDALRTIGFDGPWGVEILSIDHRRRPLLEALTAAYASAASTFTRAEPGGSLHLL